MATSLTAAAFLPLLLVVNIYCWNEGAVLLRDVQVLTLYRGRYTTARRSSPVPQLQCVGGSAGCGAFAPEVVQCQNKGWDGVDAQWECKADMDNAYRFGRVEVSCEGFNHPDDAYVLTGSCGLEYTLELTAEGQQQRPRSSRSSRSSHGSAGVSDFASSFFGGSSGGGQCSSGAGQAFQSSSGEGIGGLVGIGLLLLLAYGVYKMFLCNPTHGHERFPDDHSARGAWQVHRPSRIFLRAKPRLRLCERVYPSATQRPPGGEWLLDRNGDRGGAGVPVWQSEPAAWHGTHLGQWFIFYPTYVCPSALLGQHRHPHRLRVWWDKKKITLTR